MVLLNKKSKKGTSSIAIVLLVILTLILTITALFYFNVKEKEFNKQINSARLLKDLSSQEELINFYIQDIVERAAKEVSSEKEFVDKLNKEISNYKFSDGSFAILEFSQLEEQVTEQNVKLENNEASANFEILIVDNIADEKGVELVSKNYIYIRNFKAKVSS